MPSKDRSFYKRNGGQTMKVFITVKQAGKRKSCLSQVEHEISGDAVCLKALIEEIVLHNVKAYNNKKVDSLITNFLTSDEIEEMAQKGKVGFRERYNIEKQDPQKAVSNAIQAFEDGIYRVFINDNEIENLQTPISLKENDHLAFIKFIMLAGGMWGFNKK